MAAKLYLEAHVPATVGIDLSSSSQTLILKESNTKGIRYQLIPRKNLASGRGPASYSPVEVETETLEQDRIIELEKYQKIVILAP